jgi:flagellar M-ring protein FliF
MAGPDPQGTDLKAKAAELAGRFTTGQKALMGGVTFAVLVAMFFVMKSASTTEMAALYSNLKPADASAVTEKLTADAATYTLADGGATIMVAKDKVYDLRLKMAAEGLPQTGPEGYALLDKQGITASEFSQQVGFQRAMEGELTKTIDSMDPIASSTVHLAIPKDNVFANDEAKASASVLVKTKPGKTLDPAQVQAVVHLVASSVQDLAPEAVTVADSTGQVLAAPGEQNGGDASVDLNTKQRTGFEKNMASSIEDLIKPVVGAGKAKVTVSADLDYDQKKATSETFQEPSGDPNLTTKASESKKAETYVGAGAGEAGVLGPDGAPVAGAGATGAGTDYKLDQNDTKYLQNRVVEETKAAPGGVKRLSVAVLVDAGATAPDQVTQIQNLVSAAAGLSPQRGDIVQVSRMAFGGSEAAMAAQQKELDDAKAAESQQTTMGMARQAAVVLFLLLLLGLVYRSMRKAARRRPAALHAGDVREITRPRTPEPLPLERPTVQLPAELADPGITEEERQRDSVTKQVEDMVDQQPVEVAQMLRGWLDEGKRARK